MGMILLMIKKSKSHHDLRPVELEKELISAQVNLASPPLVSPGRGHHSALHAMPPHRPLRQISGQLGDGNDWH